MKATRSESVSGRHSEPSEASCSLSFNSAFTCPCSCEEEEDGDDDDDDCCAATPCDSNSKDARRLIISSSLMMTV